MDNSNENVFKNKIKLICKNWNKLKVKKNIKNAHNVLS